METTRRGFLGKLAALVGVAVGGATVARAATSALAPAPLKLPAYDGQKFFVCHAKPTAEEAQAIRESWNDMHRGGIRAGKIPILGGEPGSIKILRLQG